MINDNLFLGFNHPAKNLGSVPSSQGHLRGNILSLGQLGDFLNFDEEKSWMIYHL